MHAVLGKHFFKFSCNSEAFVSELLGNLGSIVSLSVSIQQPPASPRCLQIGHSLYMHDLSKVAKSLLATFSCKFWQLQDVWITSKKSSI